MPAGDDFAVETEGDLSAADAFALLDSEPRIDIIEALGDATEFGRVQRLPFSDLRRAVDIADSGRFNYHLDELKGTFVRETDDGYSLRYPGVLVHGLIRAGTLTDRSRAGPFGIDGECPACDAGLEAEYRGQLLRIGCGDCDYLLSKVHVPPGAVRTGSRDQVLRAAHASLLGNGLSIRLGVCPNCGGRVRHDVVPPGEGGKNAQQLPGPAVLHRCRDCEYHLHTTAAFALLTDPRVVSFFHERGVDLLAGPPQRHPWMAAESAVEVRSRDPWRIAVTAEAGEESLTVVVDGDLSVVDIEE